MKTKTKFTLLFSLALILALGTILLLIRTNSLQKELSEKPTELVVANISTVEAQIYWKTKENTIKNLQYKESTNSGAYKEIEEIYVIRDNLKDNYINYTTITDLKPNTEYIFKIETENYTWNNNYSFETKPISDKITLPEIEVGQEEEMAFYLVNLEDETLMINTQYHGSLAFDSQGKEYTIGKYGSYISSYDLETKLLQLLPSPVLASRGADCQTNIKKNNSSYAPSRAVAVGVLDGWAHKCPDAGYPHECYEDVYCQSVSKGVHPAFTFSIWAKESAGSNYGLSEYRTGGDFGINTDGVRGHNFTKQLDWFLNRIALKSDTYINGCKDIQTNEQKKLAWASKFYTGNCTSPEGLAKGREYLTDLTLVYSFFTNQKNIPWPFTISPISNPCDYSDAYTNTAYNTCSSKGTQTTPSSSSASSSFSSTSKDYMVVTGEGYTSKDRACRDTNGCICMWGYKESKYDYKIEVQQGQTCTIDRQVIQSPPPVEDVCCLQEGQLTFIKETECTGEAIRNISQYQCRGRSRNIEIKEGVNFIEAYTIVNNQEVPINTAKSLIEYTQGKVLAVGLFRNDQWEQIVKMENGTINGQDFNLEGGESYLVIATEDITINALTMDRDTELDIQTLVGWNLVPTSLLRPVSIYAKTILQNPNYNFINQIAVWQDKSSMFEYNLRDTSGQIYGNSLVITNQDGFFIKIPQ